MKKNRPGAGKRRTPPASPAPKPSPQDWYGMVSQVGRAYAAIYGPRIARSLVVAVKAFRREFKKG